MAGDFSVDLGLSTMAQGSLENDFQEKYRDVINSLKKGQKGSVSIKLEFERPADMDSLLTISYEVSVTKPKKKVATIASIEEDDNQQLFLRTDAPAKIDYTNVTILDKEREAK